MLFMKGGFMSEGFGSSYVDCNDTLYAPRDWEKNERAVREQDDYAGQQFAVQKKR